MPGSSPHTDGEDLVVYQRECDDPMEWGRGKFGPGLQSLLLFTVGTDGSQRTGLKSENVKAHELRPSGVAPGPL